MSTQNCPYPGLRPFTVEESVFFKGRDLHIRQIISKLEEKKILILTGASGDGKSSLVYAGVIPNARAGFFRAKYNNWLFATFRPERNPLKNFAQSISTSLQLDLDYCEKELSYGFSGLVDLYKTSTFYIDEENEEWKNTAETKKNQLKLKAANLFILADQFEEFFTNSENFTNGKPTLNSYTTVNLLLETAKIALRDKLPIYVIFTMRSDFISQSVAFRGLPESIGFSQFFVPRLNRNELQQVIEDPAILSGGKITKRLKELLINELNDGFDQLPLLQHTLRQLWEVAKNGEEEIDIIHLAKLGGINQHFIPKEDNVKFLNWKHSINELRKKFLENPSSSNILNAHANFLYETAFDYFLKNTSWADKNINNKDAKHIIKIAFQCLVKIDEGRAVRSRMSLREITNIINLPHIKYESVCGVLNIFRAQDSTFLYPFIDNSDVQTQYLSSDTVLDITHEALIRNWEYLIGWNNEELDNFNNFNDFNIQLQRWINNNKSNDYLLAIGPLSHFESWYNLCKPNKYWLAKYDTSTKDYNTKLTVAEVLADNAFEFITKSRKIIVKIEKSKKRRKNIVLIASAIIILVLSGFTFWAMSENKKAQEQKILAEQQTDSAKYQQELAIKANLLAEEQRKIAEKNEKEALISKAQSDSALIFAEKMRLIAESKTKLANIETENARIEKIKAEEQKIIADNERKNAELASDSAKTLSYLAISQSLSFKATQKFEDNQLNLLLAFQAYKFNLKYGGYDRDAVLFNALRYALLTTGQKNNFFISSNPISSFIEKNNLIYFICKNGNLISYDNNSKKLVNETNVIQQNVPISSSNFLNTNIVLVNYENKELYILDLKKGKSQKLNGHFDFVRTSVISSNEEFLITGSRDKTIKLWKTETGENYQTFTTADRVNCIVLSKDENIIYAGLNNGDFIKINISLNQIQTISSKKSSIFALQIFPNQSQVAIGYSNGEISLYDNSKNITTKNISVSNSGIRFIAINENSNLLATYSDDRIIKIFDINNLDKNPNLISDLNQKLLFFKFSGTNLIALATDNSMYIWQTNFENYANSVKSFLTRNFTQNEWSRFIGENYPYEKTN